MLIITGTIAYDYIMDFPGQFSDHILAGSEHKINLSFIVDKFARRRGGTAGNASYGLGLLETDHILFSVAGKDFEEYQKAFQRIKISTQHVKIDKQSYTATGFAVTDKIDNQIWGYFYGAADKIPELKLKTLAKKGDLVVIGPSGAAGSMSFVRQCIEQNLEYMFDPGFILTQVNDQDLELGVKHARYIIGNDYEINLIKNRLSNFSEITKDKIIITTLGKKGSLIEQNGQKITIKPVKVKEALDPTGAGDAWRAGFLAGITRGLDLRIAGQIGSVLSSYAVECYGTQEYAFTKKEFANLYLETYNTKIKL